MGVPEKPGIRELVGVSVNASALTLRQGEGPLERIAGMGGAGYRVSVGADLRNLTAAAVQPAALERRPESRTLTVTAPAAAPHDARDVLAAELGSLLLHIREGDQAGLIPRAVELFAEWLVYRKLFAEFAGDEHQSLRRKFAERAVHEWLSPHCASCRGSGKQQKSGSGQWLRPMGNMQRNAVFRPCGGCGGSGRSPARHPERMSALGITRENYDAQRWGQRFTAAQTWLSNILPGRILSALTLELERRKRRS